MTGFTVSAKGAGDLAADLRGLADGLPKSVRNIVAKTGRSVEATAKELAPKRPGSGVLARSITTTVHGNGATSTAYVGPTAHYGRYQEEGTGHNAAQPYMGPAAKVHAAAFEAAIAAVVDEFS